MDLEVIMLSEINQRKTNIIWNLKMSNSEKQRVEWLLPGVGGEGNGEILVKGYKLPVIRCTSSGALMYSMVIIANKTVSYT